MKKLHHQEYWDHDYSRRDEELGKDPHRYSLLLDSSKPEAGKAVPCKASQNQCNCSTTQRNNETITNMFEGLSIPVRKLIYPVNQSRFISYEWKKSRIEGFHLRFKRGLKGPVEWKDRNNYGNVDEDGRTNFSFLYYHISISFHFFAYTLRMGFKSNVAAIMTIIRNMKDNAAA